MATYELGPALTEIAQQLVACIAGAGDIVIDATIGNGHDTCFLARLVGANGQVIGFDVQAQALTNTQAALAAASLIERAVLHHCNHSDMTRCISREAIGEVAAVMFNLGYLPGADKAIVTSPESTISALEQACSMLRPGGLLSVLAYRGHDGAQTEFAAVARWIAAQPSHCLPRIISRGSSAVAPVLFLLQHQ